MTTIKEISEISGFSIATVSKVLNHQKGVSKKTQKEILDVANKLDYRPNLYARQLKMGSSNTLGIIAEDLTVFVTPNIIDGIGVCCDDKNYHYILGNLRFNKRFGHSPYYNEQKEQLIDEMVNQMLSKQVDGIIYVGCHTHPIDILDKRSDTKFVCAYCYSDNINIPSIIYDDRKAGYDVGKLLISRGHKNIGVIAGIKESFNTYNRVLGFQEALFESNIPYNPNLTYYGEWDREHGFEVAKKLLNDNVTAIFAHNDLIAIGVMDYCSQNNIIIGKDIDLIGFDDRDITEICRPKLSSVSLPLFEIGHTAASVILDMIKDEKNAIPNKILLNCEVIERDSVRKG
ncbi:MAG: LacI family DNA-binding transcriptional regulator [Pleomorphochaeta sp.]